MSDERTIVELCIVVESAMSWAISEGDDESFEAAADALAELARRAETREATSAATGKAA